jgi:hypothetical protein
MGYRRYGTGIYAGKDWWAKPVGYNVFIYNHDDRKLGFYIQGLKQVLCWDSTILSKESEIPFVTQLQEFENWSFHSHHCENSQGFAFIDPAQYTLLQLEE